MRRSVPCSLRTLHGEGIGVILDVVFNHTAEGGDDAPYLISFCGIDNEVYYMRDPGEQGYYMRDTGEQGHCM